jgi:hypothetical protein
LTNELITSHTSLPGFHTRPAYGARIGLEDIVIGPHSLRRTQRHLKGVKSRDGVGRGTVGSKRGEITVMGSAERRLADGPRQ